MDYCDLSKRRQIACDFQEQQYFYYRNRYYELRRAGVSGIACVHVRALMNQSLVQWDKASKGHKVPLGTVDASIN